MVVSPEVIQILLDRIEVLVGKNASHQATIQRQATLIAHLDREKVEALEERKSLEDELASCRTRVDSLLTVSENLRAAIGRQPVEVEWIGGDNMPPEQWLLFPQINFIKFLRNYAILPAGGQMSLKETKDFAESGGKLLLPATVVPRYNDLIASGK